MTSEVPQGPVLKPGLIIEYVNDMTKEMESEVFLFADDMKPMRKIQPRVDQERLQMDLNKL